jgi:hypothetical protein
MRLNVLRKKEEPTLGAKWGTAGSSAWDAIKSTFGSLGSAVDAWNQATAVPIPRQYVGGTPENTAARRQFTQDVAEALVPKNPEMNPGNLFNRQWWDNKLEVGRNRVDVAAGRMPPPIVAPPQEKTRGPVVKTEPLPLPQLPALSPTASPSAATAPAATQRAQADLAAAVAHADTPYGLNAPANRRTLTQRAIAGSDPIATFLDAARNGSPRSDDSNQAWEAIQNPDVARLGPGDATIPGRHNLDLRQTGYAGFSSVGVNPTPPTNPAQPQLTVLPSDAGAMQRAAIERARTAQDEVERTTIRASRFDENGNPLPQQAKLFKLTDDYPADRAEYLRRALAARDAARRGDTAAYRELSPGAWRGGGYTPDEWREQTWDKLDPEVKEGIRARQAAREVKYLPMDTRQALVTARAQGRSISPAQASIEGILGRGGQLNPSQSAMAFGPAYLNAEAAKAQSTANANAEVEKARINAAVEAKKYDPGYVGATVLGNALAQPNFSAAGVPYLMGAIGSLLNLGQPTPTASADPGAPGAAPAPPSSSGLPGYPGSAMTKLRPDHQAMIQSLIAAGKNDELANYLRAYTSGMLIPEEQDSILQFGSKRHSADLAHPGGRWFQN